MIEIRQSEVGDVPALKRLWQLAFGDEQGYIDHFFAVYYQPQRMLVLAEGGLVRAMTAWFDMPIVTTTGEYVPSAYLYAVATDPEVRGKGFAGRLLAWTGDWLRERGVQCLTTVPASPSLHTFFGQNGFAEQFVLTQREYRRTGWGQRVALTPVDGCRYGRLREKLLSGTTHVAYSAAALAYQEGVCTLSGGGLYQLGERGCACAELNGDTLVVKELIISQDQQTAAMGAIAQRHPAQRYVVRTPWRAGEQAMPFAMSKWLVHPPSGATQQGYLGLAFD